MQRVIEERVFDRLKRDWTRWCVVELELDQEHWPPGYAAAEGWRLFGVEIRAGTPGTYRFTLLDCRRDDGAILGTAEVVAAESTTRFVFAIRGASATSKEGAFDLIRLDERGGTRIESIALTGSAVPPRDLTAPLDDWHGHWFSTHKTEDRGIRPPYFSKFDPEGEERPLELRTYNLGLWSWNLPGSEFFVSRKCPAAQPNVLMMGMFGYSVGDEFDRLERTPIAKWPGAVLSLLMSFTPGS